MAEAVSCPATAMTGTGPSPGLDDGQQDIGPDAQPGQQRLVELPRRLVHHAGCRSVGVFAYFPAGEQVGQQVRHEENAFGGSAYNNPVPEAPASTEMPDVPEMPDTDSFDNPPAFDEPDDSNPYNDNKPY